MDALTNDDYGKILDALPCYVTLQNRKLGIIWCNESYRRDFGSPDGRTCYEFYGLGKTKCLDCPVERTFSDGLVHTKEMTFTINADRRLDFVIYSSPVYEGEKIVSVLETAVNITSIKDIQKQLILVGQAVAGMAHSIKNIMMGLEGGIYVVNRGLEDKKQEEIKDGWEMVLLNFDKISRLVKDILYCSKDRAPNLKKVNLNEIVKEIYLLYKESASRYNIDMKLELDQNLKEAVVDPDGLNTVLTNLVTNAMDACKIDLWKDEHLIEIRTHKGKNGSTVIEVADNGTGIDKEIKEHVFGLLTD